MSNGKAVRLLLIRHGQSEGNRLRRFSPDNHIDLTDHGVEQAREAGRRIGARFEPTRIVASPYHRTQRTARLLAQAMGHRGPIDTEHDLREREIGDLAGAPYAAMAEDPAYDPGRFWDWRPPRGESLVDVIERSGPVIDALLAGGEQTVVVSHGGVMLALRAYLDGHWDHSSVSANCEILVVVANDAGGFCVRSADEHHQHVGGDTREGTG